MDTKPEEIPGHIEAMKSLAKLAVDSEDFATWHERFKAKEAAEKAKQDSLDKIRAEIVPPSVKVGPNDLVGYTDPSTPPEPSEWVHPDKKKAQIVWKREQGYWHPPKAKQMYAYEPYKPAPKDPNKPLRMEVYSPPQEIEEEAKKRGLKFTVGREYPIYAEVPEENRYAGMRVITTDDEGNRRSVNGVHFNTPINLKTDWYEESRPMQYNQGYSAGSSCCSSSCSSVTYPSIIYGSSTSSSASTSSLGNYTIFINSDSTV